MTERLDVSVLSTMPSKLSRDIHFSTAVGRDSPFDPFAGRDITKLFSEKKEPSAHLMYFPNHPRRHHTPALSIARGTGRNAISGAVATNPSNDVMYDPVKMPVGTAVSFTKAPRKVLSHIPERTPSSSSPSGPSGGNNAELFKLTSVTAEELMTSRERNAYRASQRPQSQMSQRAGVSFANSAGRAGRAPVSGAKTPAGKQQQQQQQPARPSTTDPGQQRKPPRPLRASSYEFPWDEEKASNDKAAATAKKRRHEQQLQQSMQQQQQSMQASVNLNASGAMDDFSTASPAASLRGGGDQQPQHLSASGTVEAEEQWMDKRREVLDRFGLLGAANARHADAPRGADFRTTGRSAPVGFQPRGKETNDVGYAPKDSVTTKTRSVARVELGKQAGRPDPKGKSAYLSYVEGLLDYDRLAKLHKATREKEERSFSRADNNNTTSANGGGRRNVSSTPGVNASSSSNNADPAFARPLSAADEVAYHPETLRPPSRTVNAVAHTTDAFLAADRADEPIAAVLGGDPRPYRLSAKRALSTMA